MGGCGREGGEAGTWWAGVLLAVALWGAKDEVLEGRGVDGVGLEAIRG